MLPRPDHHDEAAFDAAISANHHWMRFCATLRMMADDSTVIASAHPQRPAQSATNNSPASPNQRLGRGTL
jgi:hypothetical protein